MEDWESFEEDTLGFEVIDDEAWELLKSPAIRNLIKSFGLMLVYMSFIHLHYSEDPRSFYILVSGICVLVAESYLALRAGEDP